MNKPYDLSSYITLICSVCSVCIAESKLKLNIFHGDLPFSSKEIMRKIEMLDDTNVIGCGGFGTVYKLVMDDHNVFAVKKIEKQGKLCERIFERELEILGILRHRNLVNLRGYCSACSMNLLIYDFLPNGNLENLLHGKSGYERFSLALHLCFNNSLIYI